MFVTRLSFLDLCLQDLCFRGLPFRVLENADLENADPANKDLEKADKSQTLEKITAFARERIMAAINLKTAFARERNEFKSLSSSFLFIFEVCVFEVCVFETPQKNYPDE